MSSRERPPAPRYAPATRRLALIRVGLPTLLACVFAVGSALGLSAPARGAQRIAALVGHTTATAASLLDRHSETHPGDATADATRDER